MTAIEVAKYFLRKQVGGENEITNMKLQKLLYYGQGFHLALRGKPLFEDEIERWDLGPVVPNVYHYYKNSGGKPIEPPKTFDASLYPGDTGKLLDDVYKVYGQFSAWRLSDMTHSEPPWKNTAPNSVISHSALRVYFRTRIKDGKA